MGQTVRRSRLGKRLFALAIAAMQTASVIAGGELVTRLPALATTFACNAGKDGAAGSLSGSYNTYYVPPNGTLAAGATTVPLGAMDVSNGGAATAVAANDLLLIIQMQDGTLNSVNSTSYGLTSVGNAGLYEYVQVASVAGGNATIVGAGTGGGLLNTYKQAAAVPGVSGQQTYQIIRVPQYVSATLTSTFHAAYWDGKTGGVAALDIATTLNLGGASLYATGDGFRGGGVSVTSTSPASILNNDWAASATMNGTPTSNPPAHGFKGEGILGTPAFTFGYTNFTTPSTPTSPSLTKTSTDGYPGGDVARGAPGNGGGGGTDADPAANDQNTGGGGGANAGPGGNGGYPWSPNNPSYPLNTAPGQHTAGSYAPADANHNPDIGGRGAAALTPSVARVFMGGGGGAGTNNNGSNNNSQNNYGSSGGTGGGIIMMRIADTSGAAATIYADGTSGLAPDNDGGGGGGAGGSVIVTSPNAFTGITVDARGAAGTSAYLAAGDTSITTAHGPGGGGGGGTVYSSSPVTATVTGGANGVTVTGQNLSYGATSGAAGSTGTVSYDQIPGAPSGAECYNTVPGTNTLYVGPVDGSEPTYSGADYTGSYNGVQTATNNNDFTARSFVPAGATFVNSSTVPGSPIGNTLSGTASVSVPNEAYYNNTSNAAKNVTLTATAPLSPSGWTVQLCPDNAGAPDCSGGTTTPFSPSTAGSTSSVTYSVKKHTVALNQVWTVFSVPANTVAFTRYDALIDFSDATLTNYTHNELYAGFIPITKQTTIASSGCPAGETPGPSGICPGGVLRYTLDYRNIMAGGGLGTEGQLLSAFVSTAAGQFALTDNGAAAGNNWSTKTNGLKEALLAGLGSGGNTTCGAVANKCGDTTTGTTFTGNVIGSTSFTATIGGASFQLTPPGYTTGTSQGTITFAVVIK